ncbi:MAG: diheme cytochrome c-553 [Vicinamibacterales bacterium]
MRLSAVLAMVACLALLVALPSLEAALQQPKSPYPPAKPMKFAPDATSARRGEQLVMLGGCHDCHTPKLPGGAFDRARALSGHQSNTPLAPDIVGGASTNLMLTAWKGPWGSSLARNITPDKETGIGTWSLEDFKKTMRTGVNPKGEVLMPPMPIPTLQNVPDEDLGAIYAFLMSVKPIRNVVGRPAGAPAGARD